MNEEKIIAILRYFGVSRCRPLPNTYNFSQTFKLQWPVAKRWMRILEAIPQEEGSYARLKDLADKYQEIDMERAKKHCLPEPKPVTRIEDLYGIPSVMAPVETEAVEE